MTPQAPDRAARLRANRRGRRAELLATLWLITRRYGILERGFCVSGGEIDIIARRGATVAFVEVKQRSSLDAALLAVTETKRRRIERAAAVWLSRNPWATAYTLRGDAVLIARNSWPRHVEDAFDLDIGH